MKKIFMTLILIFMCLPLCVKAGSEGPHYISWVIDEERRGFFLTENFDYEKPFEIEGYVKQEFITPDDLIKTNFILAKDAKFEEFYFCDEKLELTVDTSLILNGNNVIEDSEGHYTLAGDGTLTVKTISGNYMSNEIFYASYRDPEGKFTALLRDEENATLKFKNIDEVKEIYDELKKTFYDYIVIPETGMWEKVYLADEFDEKNFVLKPAEIIVSGEKPTKELIDIFFHTEMNYRFNEDGSVTFYNEEKTNEEVVVPTEPEEEVDLVDTKNDVKLNFLDDKFDSSYSLVTENKIDTLTTEEKKNIVGENKEMLALYDISVAKSGVIVEVKDSKLEIKLPFKEDVSKFDYIKVAYIKDGKIAEELDAKLENGYVVFNTTHLSEYAVIGYNKVDEEKPVSPVNPNTVDMINVYALLSISGIIGLVSTGLYLKRKA